ncbi:MAG TPA: nucleoside-triphosphatase [Spirochaetota bacterium]|nr:nucleoside-triphosphatase [Spirochaetota bacterium]HNU91310.1 nucleoside-triphosphatase [Spirochaetota bacterium]HPV98470.1 nucleoside-triphosphatase [Spirochaetota bacterium]
MRRAALHIITGGRDSGKTARIRALYDEKPGGDGYACPKVFLNGVHEGYDALNLRTGATAPLARKKNALPLGWDEFLARGEYSFSGRGLEFLDSILEGLAARRAERVFLDEIGSLEMQREGFRFLLAGVMDSCEELYASVRRNRVAEFVEITGAVDYTLTDLDA